MSNYFTSNTTHHSTTSVNPIEVDGKLVLVSGKLLQCGGLLVPISSIELVRIGEDGELLFLEIVSGKIKMKGYVDNVEGFLRELADHM